MPGTTGRVRLMDATLGTARFGPGHRTFSTHDLGPSTAIRSPPPRSPERHSCWWEPPHLCGGKVRLLIARFSAGDRKNPGLKPRTTHHRSFDCVRCALSGQDDKKQRLGAGGQGLVKAPELFSLVSVRPRLQGDAQDVSPVPVYPSRRRREFRCGRVRRGAGVCCPCWA